MAANVIAATAVMSATIEIRIDRIALFSITVQESVIRTRPMARAIEIRKQVPKMTDR